MTRDDAAAGYLTRKKELQREREALAGRDRRLSTLRGLAFLLAAALAGYALFRPSAELWTAAAVAAVGFVVLVVLHAIVSTRQFDLERRLTLCQRGLERLDGSYRAPPGEEHRRGDAFVDADHPYSGDLDLFGAASLFEQLNTTQTPGGEEMLARWLSAPAPPDEVAARQSAARELARMDALREEMAVAGMRAGKIDRDAQPFLTWATQRSDFGKRTALAAGGAALLAVTAALIACAWLFEGSWTRAWMGAVAVQLLWMGALRSKLEPIIGPVSVKQSPLATYQDLMRLVEGASFEDRRLLALRAELCEPVGAAEAMGRLDRLVGLASVRHNALVLILADAFLLWDLWCAFLLDRWRARHGRRVASWLEALSEIEALASIATFAREHPEYAWPKVTDGPTRFSAVAVGHPLIRATERVANDAELDAALMITGSNMSGKSTMLRSIGLGAVLAQSGAPVCARELAMSPLRLFTSMRVGDALDRGVSRFYMEIEKLKRVVDALDEPGAPVLFLLDEVLHGTNSRERNIGAKAVVRHLVERGAVGGVSSHDLGLVELESLTGGRVRNVHFEDHIESGRMCFDYRMKAGPVSTSNALRLMRSVGIDVPGLEQQSSE